MGAVLRFSGRRDGVPASKCPHPPRICAADVSGRGKTCGMATQYYTGSSLDGFIADPQHSLSWLVTRDIDGKGPMSYDAFFEHVGAMAMGATTYQWVLDNESGPWPYELPCWVFTHRKFPDPGRDVRFTSDEMASVHAQMTEAADGKNIWLV